MEKKYHETHGTNPLTQITNADFWYPLKEISQQLIANHREKRMVGNKDKENFGHTHVGHAGGQHVGGQDAGGQDAGQVENKFTHSFSTHAPG